MKVASLQLLEGPAILIRLSSNLVTFCCRWPLQFCCVLKSIDNYDNCLLLYRSVTYRYLVPVLPSRSSLPSAADQDIPQEEIFTQSDSFLSFTDLFEGMVDGPKIQLFNCIRLQFSLLVVNAPMCRWKNCLHSFFYFAFKILKTVHCSRAASHCAILGNH